MDGSVQSLPEHVEAEGSSPGRQPLQRSQSFQTADSAPSPTPGAGGAAATLSSSTSQAAAEAGYVPITRIAQGKGTLAGRRQQRRASRNAARDSPTSSDSAAPAASPTAAAPPARKKRSRSRLNRRKSSGEYSSEELLRLQKRASADALDAGPRVDMSAAERIETELSLAKLDLRQSLDMEASAAEAGGDEEEEDEEDSNSEIGSPHRNGLGRGANRASAVSSSGSSTAGSQRSPRRTSRPSIDQRGSGTGLGRSRLSRSDGDEKSLRAELDTLRTDMARKNAEIVRLSALVREAHSDRDLAKELRAAKMQLHEEGRRAKALENQVRRAGRWGGGQAEECGVGRCLIVHMR